MPAGRVTLGRVAAPTRKHPNDGEYADADDVVVALIDADDLADALDDARVSDLHARADALVRAVGLDYGAPHSI